MNKFSLKEIEFLFESNNIENERGAVSLMQALYAWEYLRQLDVMTVGIILDVHKILMLKNRFLYPNEKGYFRTVDVFIGGRKKMYISTTLFIEELTALIDKMDAKLEDDSKQTKVWHAKNCHVLFENIHPFVDGNGRVGRMIYNWHRMQMGLPIDVIHEGDEQQSYYSWFK